ncbi:hypothetical protein BsWGS_17903 [Bradybaena similaris]
MQTDARHRTLSTTVCSPFSSVTIQLTVRNGRGPAICFRQTSTRVWNAIYQLRHSDGKQTSSVLLTQLSAGSCLPSCSWMGRYEPVHPRSTLCYLVEAADHHSTCHHHLHTLRTLTGPAPSSHTPHIISVKQCSQCIGCVRVRLQRVRSGTQQSSQRFLQLVSTSLLHCTEDKQYYCTGLTSPSRAGDPLKDTGGAGVGNPSVTVHPLRISNEESDAL